MQSPDPSKIARWVERSTTAKILKKIVEHTTRPTYEDLSRYPQTQATPVRALLEAGGILDPSLAPDADFQHWLTGHISCTPPPRRDLLRRFALWGVRRRTKTNNSNPKLSSTESQLVRARQRVRIADEFLTFLDDNNTDIHHADHSLYDQFLATHPNSKTDLTSLIRWLRASRIPTRLKPSRLTSTLPTTMLNAEEYQSTVKGLIANKSFPTRARLVGLLVGLFGLKLSRIASLEVDNIITNNPEFKLHLASDAIAVPKAMADLLAEQLSTAQRQAQGTNSTWLFPSPNAGRHLNPATLGQDMKRLGIDTVALRGAASLNLVHTLPMAVAHDFTGMAYSTLHRWAVVNGHNWSIYPALRAH